jgi:hypothetical protein
VRDWKRITRFDRICKTSVGLVVAGFVFAGLVVNLMRQGVSAVALLPAFAFVVVFLITAWRGIFVGVYVNDTGVRVFGLTRTWTIPWDEVAGFEVRRAPTYPTDAIWVIRRQGGSVPTPIVLGGLHLTHRLYRRSLEWLSPQDFEAMLDRLRSSRPNGDLGQLGRL